MRVSEYYEQIWKCGRCGYCAGGHPDDRCPSRFLGGFESSTARGKLLIARALMKGELDPSGKLAERVYECSLCGSCETICDTIIHLELTDILETLRADLVEAGLGPMPRHKEILDWIMEENNPYMERHEDRLKWIPQGKNASGESEILYFTGCTAPYRQPEISRAFLQVMEAAGVGVHVAPQEWCCGSVCFRVGARDVGMTLAEHNVELFKSLGVKSIVTHCPGCYKTLKQDYPKLVGELPLKILHASKFIEGLLSEGKLKLNGKVDGKATYHDPCHLGRHADMYDSPRRVLESIPGVELVEMERTRQDSWCCGAGGGLKSAFPDSALKVGYERIREAEQTEAKYLVSACPFCRQNLKDSAEGQIEVYDLLELLARAI
ncbi:MAG: (Fe-S)-binding protein [Candidatus Thorarchaeota archaeon]